LRFAVSPGRPLAAFPRPVTTLPTPAIAAIVSTRLTVSVLSARLVLAVRLALGRRRDGWRRLRPGWPAGNDRFGGLARGRRRRHFLGRHLDP